MVRQNKLNKVLAFGNGKGKHAIARVDLNKNKLKLIQDNVATAIIKPKQFNVCQRHGKNLNKFKEFKLFRP